MAKQSKIFGIVSYFPTKEPDRSQRISRFAKLITKLHSLWPDIPIMVIAQNWKNYKCIIRHEMIVYRFEERLGILKARKTLREKYLQTNYDYLIMLDDDGIIKCDVGWPYMQEIDEHPNSIGFFRHRMCPLMLLAISHNLYEQIDMPNVDPEKGEGFEDDIFVEMCINKFPEQWWDFSHDSIEEISFLYDGADVASVPTTWDHSMCSGENDIYKNTDKIIAKIQSKNKK